MPHQTHVILRGLPVLVDLRLIFHVCFRLGEWLDALEKASPDRLLLDFLMPAFRGCERRLQAPFAGCRTCWFFQEEQQV